MSMKEHEMHRARSGSMGGVTIAVIAALVLLVAGCAAGDPRFTAANPAGFWQGLWHGIISVIAFIVSLFKDGVGIYEVHNTGHWYDFGFLIGVI
jgi:uncharacterized spore protein YtfJ